MSEELSITITGESSIYGLSVAVAIGLQTLNEMAESGDLGKLERQFAKEVLNQLAESKPLSGIPQPEPEAASNLFLKRALATLQNNIDNPPPPEESKWEKRLREVRQAQADAEAKKKFKDETSKYV